MLPFIDLSPIADYDVRYNLKVGNNEKQINCCMANQIGENF